MTRPLLQLACACSAGLLAIAAAWPSQAEDIEPKVVPDRIEDVPATKPDPFPAFANFAWRAFIALNWPALTDPAHRGEPDRSKTLGDSGPRVWETFKARWEVFAHDQAGRAIMPSGWDSYAGPNPCGPAVDNQTKTLSSPRTFADFNQASFALGKFANPLVAQNRTYTRYEVRFNREEFDSILDHGWYLRRRLPTAHRPGRFNIGSIEIKAAWRILDANDTPATRKRFYVVPDAWVLDVAKSLQAGSAVCSRHDVALVGLHIVIKTTYRPQWIWSSFEHIDNVPPIGSGESREPDARDAAAPYSYNDPSKGETNLDPPFGSPGTESVSGSHPPQVEPQPMQVVRQHLIHPGIMAINRAYWALPAIRDTVFANYMLVMTQWPTAPQPNSPENDGAFFPGARTQPNTVVDFYQLPGATLPDTNVANTTMETYQQDSSSCMACHHAVANTQGHDFVAFMAFDANADGHVEKSRRPAATHPRVSLRRSIRGHPNR